MRRHAYDTSAPLFPTLAPCIHLHVPGIDTPSPPSKVTHGHSSIREDPLRVYDHTSSHLEPTEPRMSASDATGPRPDVKRQRSQHSRASSRRTQSINRTRISINCYDLLPVGASWPSSFSLWGLTWLTRLGGYPLSCGTLACQCCIPAW